MDWGGGEQWIGEEEEMGTEGGGGEEMETGRKGRRRWGQVKGAGKLACQRGSHPLPGISLVRGMQFCPYNC